MPSSIEVSTCKPVSVHSVPHCSSVTSADVFNTDKMHIDLMLYQLLQLQRPALSSRQKIQAVVETKLKDMQKKFSETMKCDADVVSGLSTRVERLDAYSRANNLVIIGLPVEKL